MSRSSRGLIRSLLALAFVAALVPAAQAATTQKYQTQKYQTPKRHHHVYERVVVRHPGEIYVTKAPRSYLDYGDPGVSPDYTSDLYFEDTAYPQYLLGPGIFQRLLTSPGQYN
jgi:hypothetical protein